MSRVREAFESEAQNDRSTLFPSSTFIQHRCSALPRTFWENQHPQDTSPVSVEGNYSGTSHLNSPQAYHPARCESDGFDNLLVFYDSATGFTTRSDIGPAREGPTEA